MEPQAATRGRRATRARGGSTRGRGNTPTRSLRRNPNPSTPKTPRTRRSSRGRGRASGLVDTMAERGTASPGYDNVSPHSSRRSTPVLIRYGTEQSSQRSSMADDLTSTTPQHATLIQGRGNLSALGRKTNLGAYEGLSERRGSQRPSILSNPSRVGTGHSTVIQGSQSQSFYTNQLSPASGGYDTGLGFDPSQMYSASNDPTLTNYSHGITMRGRGNTPAPSLRRNLSPDTAESPNKRQLFQGRGGLFNSIGGNAEYGFPSLGYDSLSSYMATNHGYDNLSPQRNHLRPASSGYGAQESSQNNPFEMYSAFIDPALTNPQVHYDTSMQTEAEGYDNLSLFRSQPQPVSSGYGGQLSPLPPISPEVYAAFLDPALTTPQPDRVASIRGRSLSGSSGQPYVTTPQHGLRVNEASVYHYPENHPRRALEIARIEAEFDRTNPPRLTPSQRARLATASGHGAYAVTQGQKTTAPSSVQSSRSVTPNIRDGLDVTRGQDLYGSQHGISSPGIQLSAASSNIFSRSETPSNRGQHDPTRGRGMPGNRRHVPIPKPQNTEHWQDSLFQGTRRNMALTGSNNGQHLSLDQNIDPPSTIAEGHQSLAARHGFGPRGSRRLQSSPHSVSAQAQTTHNTIGYGGSASDQTSVQTSLESSPIQRFSDPTIVPPGGGISHMTARVIPATQDQSFDIQRETTPTPATRSKVTPSEVLTDSASKRGGSKRGEISGRNTISGHDSSSNRGISKEQAQSASQSYSSLAQAHLKPVFPPLGSSSAISASWAARGYGIPPAQRYPDRNRILPSQATQPTDLGHNLTTEEDTNSSTANQWIRPTQRSLDAHEDQQQLLSGFSNPIFALFAPESITPPSQLTDPSYRSTERLQLPGYNANFDETSSHSTLLRHRGDSSVQTQQAPNFLVPGVEPTLTPTIPSNASPGSVRSTRVPSADLESFALSTANGEGSGDDIFRDIDRYLLDPENHAPEPFGAPTNAPNEMTPYSERMDMEGELAGPKTVLRGGSSSSRELDAIDRWGFEKHGELPNNRRTQRAATTQAGQGPRLGKFPAPGTSTQQASGSAQNTVPAQTGRAGTFLMSSAHSTRPGTPITPPTCDHLRFKDHWSACDENPSRFSTIAFPIDAVGCDTAGFLVHRGTLRACENAAEHTGEPYLVCQGCACAAHHLIKATAPRLLESVMMERCATCSQTLVDQDLVELEKDTCTCPIDNPADDESGKKHWLCYECRVSALDLVQKKKGWMEEYTRDVVGVGIVAGRTETWLIGNVCICGGQLRQVKGFVTSCAACGESKYSMPV